MRRVLLAAVLILFAAPVFGQNYARYCARDTDQLATDLTHALTSQDENYVATLYYWAGFNAENGYRKMDDFIRMTKRSLIEVTPIGGGIAQRGIRMQPQFQILTAGLGQVPPVTPVEDTPEIAPYSTQDERGLGTLPTLPTDEPYGTPHDPGILPDDATHDREMVELRRRAEDFDRTLNRELQDLAQVEAWQSGIQGMGNAPASAIRVEQEEGRIRARKVFTVFGIIKFEDCYWLTGG